MKRSFKTPEERRKYARLDLRTKVEVSVSETEASGPSKVFEVLGKDIGVEGIRLMTEKRFSPGTILNLLIHFPYRTEPVAVQGEVRWCSPVKPVDDSSVLKDKGQYDTGLKFLTIDKNHIMLLVKYVCGNFAEGFFKSL